MTEIAAAAAAPAPKKKREHHFGWTGFFIKREGVSVPIWILSWLYFYALPWRPNWDNGIAIYIMTFLQGAVVVWFLVANAFAAIESTKDKNLGNDDVLPRENFYTLVMWIATVVPLIIGAVALGLRVGNILDPNSGVYNLMVLTWTDLAYVIALMIVTWIDMITNNKQIGRTQRVMPENRIAVQAPQ